MRALPRPQLSALREQPRYWGTCIFYDEGANACGIHPVKPSICRAYGLYANLRCFRDPGAAADSPWRVDEAPAGVLSVDFTWSDFR